MNRGSNAPPEWGQAPPRSFNEAPIHESGKSFDPHGVRRLDRHASMRPRFMNRGSGADRQVFDPELDSLQ